MGLLGSNNFVNRPEPIPPWASVTWQSAALALLSTAFLRCRWPLSNITFGEGKYSSSLCIVSGRPNKFEIFEERYHRIEFTESHGHLRPIMAQLFFCQKI